MASDYQREYYRTTTKPMRAAARVEAHAEREALRSQPHPEKYPLRAVDIFERLEVPHDAISHTHLGDMGDALVKGDWLPVYVLWLRCRTFDPDDGECAWTAYDEVGETTAWMRQDGLLADCIAPDAINNLPRNSLIGIIVSWQKWYLYRRMFLLDLEAERKLR